MKIHGNPLAFFETSIHKNHIAAIIQFGSSLRRESHRDLDVAVVVRRGLYEKFLQEPRRRRLGQLDISVIREEEVLSSRKFRFGGHGAHFLYSLIHGRTLYGTNPFKRFKVIESQIRRSVLLRLYDYIEDVRRAVVQGNIRRSIRKRWQKFLRLSLFLLDSKLHYFEALDLSDNAVYVLLKRKKIILNEKNLLLDYEILWQRVLRRYKFIK